MAKLRQDIAWEATQEYYSDGSVWDKELLSALDEIERLRQQLSLYDKTNAEQAITLEAYRTENEALRDWQRRAVVVISEAIEAEEDSVDTFGCVLPSVPEAQELLKEAEEK